MIDVGDKVKWTGKTIGEFRMPDYLTEDMIGEVASIDEEAAPYIYGVWWTKPDGETDYEVFVEGEIERI